MEGIYSLSVLTVMYKLMEGWLNIDIHIDCTRPALWLADAVVAPDISHHRSNRRRWPELVVGVNSLLPRMKFAFPIFESC